MTPLSIPSANPVTFALQTARLCLRTLQSAPDLSPQSPAIHVALASLEGLCRTPYSKAQTDAIIATLNASGDLQALRDVLAEAEHADEHFHAQQILSAANDAFNLQARVNTTYARMVENEIALVRQHAPKAHGYCVFVGCGALPLTAVYINHFSAMPVTALDAHARCACIGCRVKDKIGANGVSIVTARGEDYDYKNAAVVYVASMVPNKADVFRRVRDTNPGAIVLTRGGADLRQLFYAPVDIAELSELGWECIAVSPPPDGVKNTSYLFKLK